MKNYTVVFKNVKGEILEISEYRNRNSFKDVFKQLPTCFVDLVDGRDNKVYAYIFTDYDESVHPVQIAEFMDNYNPFLVVRGFDITTSCPGYTDWDIKLAIDLLINGLWTYYKRIVIAC